jgi:hypothetical protein
MVINAGCLLKQNDSFRITAAVEIVLLIFFNTIMGELFKAPTLSRAGLIFVLQSRKPRCQCFSARSVLVFDLIFFIKLKSCSQQ